MISVLCPTRGRPRSMRESAASLLDLADHPDRVEILTWVDDDDPTLAEYDPPPTVTGPRHGYRGLHLYVNHLADIARGEWLFLWNDDARMQTKGWDTIIQAEESAVLSPETTHGGSPTSIARCVFPVVPTRWVRKVGHFALNCHNDTWWAEIGKALGKLRPVDVFVFHDRHDLTGGHGDATYEEREYDPAYYSPAMVAARHRDVEVLRCASVG